MKLLIFLLLVPAIFMLVSGTSDTQQPPAPLDITRAVVKIPSEKLPELKRPILIRIEHQGFPFDVNGRFPFVVMIDNTVYRANPDAVREFLSNGIYVNLPLND